MENFVGWLEKELRDRDWRPADLARRARLTDATISRILSQDRKPGPDVCVAIAQALGKPPEQVFRLAGLLPPLPGPEDDQVIKEISEMFQQLTPERRRAVLEYALFQAQQQAHDEDESTGEQNNVGRNVLGNAT